MLGRRTKPVIGKLTGWSDPGHRVTTFSETITSPRSPLEYKIQSPRGIKSYDIGGVGLAIVAALEKSGGSGEGPGKTQTSKAVYSRNLSRSNPIPVNSGKTSARSGGGILYEESDEDSLEDYTFVTRHHRPNDKSFTRIYCDGGLKHNKAAAIDRRDLDLGRRSTSTKCSSHMSRPSVFNISPAPFTDFTSYPAPDFLNSCHLCQKRLQGKDIYMYRGEKAFCSPECRYRQIVMDERKEKCSSEASRSADVSSSPYTKSEMFSTGILAI